MSVKTLHYIYDPLCGWCYGIAPFIQAAHKQGVTIALHGGGMITGSQRRPADDSMRDMIRSHNQRITQMTGQPFTDAFYALLKNQEWVMDSVPPIAAILSAQAQSGKGIDMLDACQKAYYQDGLPLNHDTLRKLADTLGISDIQSDNTEQHISESRQLFVHNPTGGFPTLLLEEDGVFQHIPNQAVLGAESYWERLIPLLKTTD
ncbi:TPA: DsbA family protein [Morganella morganii subsp. sibonii]|nr:DsbA family protein [Morganella morganii]HDS6844081.1 DsbA family protein [Morganella morganii subsp. morganii]HDU8310842.1 DsbA family protein [Morganella morganii subsp. sibonii]EGT3631744.1 DsbA family protein [Morganella morganii]EGT3633244.1 DsbA family protein [Morganella morganii]